MFRGRRVVEFEVVRAVVHADVVFEGLVQVVEERYRCGFCVDGVLAMTEASAGGLERRRVLEKRKWGRTRGKLICRNRGLRGGGWRLWGFHDLPWSVVVEGNGVASAGDVLHR